MIRTSRSRSAELEAAALGRAGRRYLVATRSAKPEDYERAEEEAWRELLHALERLGRPLPREVGR